MSVGIYEVKYVLSDEIEQSRAVANWLGNHFHERMGGEGGTIIEIFDHDLEECIEDAKDCTGCDFFTERSAYETSMDAHRKIDETMPGILRKMMTRDGSITLNIDW